MDTKPPLLPIELRLLSLESQVRGLSKSDDNPPTTSERSVIRRIQDINDALANVGGQSEALKTLLGGYEGYKSLLSLPSLDPGSHPDPSKTDGDPSGAEVDPAADSLPDTTKVTILLEAAREIQSAERDLREIELLRDRGVEGSGNLEQILPMKKDIDAARQASRERGKDLDNARREVNALLRRYNDYTTTVSDLFLELHHRVAAMEDQVAILERRKRKDLASRY